MSLVRYAKSIGREISMNASTLRIGLLVGSAYVLAFGCAPLSAQSGIEAVVDSMAAEYVETGKLAGMSVGVVRGSETLLMKAYGYADLEWDVPMPMDAIHEIGSVTKQFTSAAMLQLWAEGKVDLDADITEYLPDYDTQGRSIPLRRLFDHTSGIKGYTEMQGFEALAAQSLPRDTLVSLFEAVPLEFEPGHALIYNNSAYFLLGLIIEEASGQTYSEYLEEHVFPKAGMDDSSYCTNNEVWKGRVHGYEPGEEGLQRASYINHMWPYAAGSICSTVGDLIKWNRALHGGRIVSDEAYAMMTTPRPLEDGTPTRYAMGISHSIAPSGEVIEHGGGIPGFLSHSRYYPQEDVTIVVLLNTTTAPGPEAVVDAVGEALFGSDHLPAASSYTGDLTQFAGRYRGPARGSMLTAVVTVENDSLMVSANRAPPRAVDYLEGTTFFRGEGRFIFDVAGDEATALRIDQIGGHYVLARVDEAAEAAAVVTVPVETLEKYVGAYAVTGQGQIVITLEDGQLYGQETGQQRWPLIADSQAEFHLEVMEASVEFVMGDGDVAEAMTLHLGGRSRTGQRVPGSE